MKKKNNTQNKTKSKTIISYTTLKIKGNIILIDKGK